MLYSVVVWVRGLVFFDLIPGGFYSAGRFGYGNLFSLSWSLGFFIVLDGLGTGTCYLDLVSLDSCCFSGIWAQKKLSWNCLPWNALINGVQLMESTACTQTLQDVQKLKEYSFWKAAPVPKLDKSVRSSRSTDPEKLSLYPGSTNQAGRAAAWVLRRKGSALIT